MPSAWLPEPGRCAFDLCLPLAKAVALALPSDKGTEEWLVLTVLRKLKWAQTLGTVPGSQPSLSIGQPDCLLGLPNTGL